MYAVAQGFASGEPLNKIKCLQEGSVNDGGLTAERGCR